MNNTSVWKRLLRKILRKLNLYGTLDTERAIRSARKQGFDAGYEKGVEDGVQVRARFIPAVFVDPAGQKQAQAHIGAYEPPSPTTDGKMRASMRQRALTRQLYPNAGDLTRHVDEVERKKFITRDLAPDTVILPILPRKLHMQRYDGPPLDDETLYMPAMWLL